MYLRKCIYYLLKLYVFAVAHCGELKLAFFLSDDYLEVEIVSARELPNANTGRPGMLYTSLYFSFF